MGRAHVRWLAGALFVATVAFELASCVLSWGLEPRYDTVLYAVYSVVQAGAGALIASRHPRNPIGWLFLGFALFNAIAADALQGWGLHAAQEGWPGVAVSEWVAYSNWIPASLGLVLTFLLFPSGTLLAPRWRLVAWANVLGIVFALPGWALSPDAGSEFSGGRNPFAVTGLPTSLLFAVGASLICVSLVASVVALVVRLLRSRGIEREQLKWFVFAAAVAGVVLPVSVVLWSIVPAVRVLPALALTALPIAACIAILRYRLYDIDLVISRTIAYGTLTVLLAAAYLASALLIGIAVDSESAWVTAGATLVVAVAFRPLRARVQDVVDRHFSRARYEARRQMTDFVEELRCGRARPEDIELALRAALGDGGVELRFHLPESGIDVDSHGRPVLDDERGGRERWPIQRGGVSLGYVLLPPGSERERAFLPDVLDAASLAIEIARLRVELRRQLDDVKKSRARLVAVADDERRRIERDLHDGAQQRLVSIGLALRHAEHELGPEGNPEVERAIEGALAEIATAIDELRELARGVRPALLDAGLGPALRELAGRAPLPVEVEATTERFSPELETAAYFIACEGLTNAVKHAQAGKVVLSVGRRDGSVVVRVADDGIGGARPQDGSGLTGLSDRVVAHGGTLQIDTDEGRGTTLFGQASMRVVIAEDQVLLREGLARLFLDGGHEVVAILGDVELLAETVDEVRPDLVLLDIRMPPTFTDEGARAARTIKDSHPDIGVLLLSQHIETVHAVALVSRGGFGYLLKDRVLDVAEFLATAERVAAGGSALDPKVVASLVAPSNAGPLARLSDRERDVLELMAAGLTNAGIATRLVVSERTVEAHVRHVLMKLDIPESEDANRRVLAVLSHLRAAHDWQPEAETC